ncbi:MAG: phosphodiester glycosidase family protein [Chloroflexota bacterium]|nr:phosphodiester glycosidase family protein [Chloroflexota bacterium]
MYEPISRILHFLLLTIFIGAVGSSVYYIKADSSLPAVATFVSTPVPTVRPTVNPVPEPGWTLLQAGLERRVFEIYDSQNQHVESLYVWRLDQNYFRLDVAYEERPKTLDRWQQETNAALVLNGGYYSIDNERYFPDGLTIVDGVASGRSFRGHGGMLAIQEHGAELRWLEAEPYQPSEQIRAALQSFPVLVRPGGQLGYGPERESGARARRTVIAQDVQGRILLMVAPLGHFTLHELSAYLTTLDLNLDLAVNLDGGGSTGILVANPRELIPPTRPIPFVILVFPR